MVESFSLLAVAALEAYIREWALQQEIQQLRIEINEETFGCQVAAVLPYSYERSDHMEDAEIIDGQHERGQPVADIRGHILVVDDNPVGRMHLKRSLERQGHTVALAEDGRQALEMLDGGCFDLVLLDILMPEMNGYQVLACLKGDPARRDLPVIVISAVDEVESIIRCIGLGAEDYLPKPFDPFLLRARIGASLEKKRLRDQEVEYLQQVARVTEAAAAVEAGQFVPDSLDAVAARPDALGQLSRVFQRMAREVYSREQSLRQQVQELRIQIDETTKAREVAEITGSEYFRGLKDRAPQLRGEGRR